MNDTRKVVSLEELDREAAKRNAATRAADPARREQDKFFAAHDKIIQDTRRKRGQT